MLKLNRKDNIFKKKPIAKVQINKCINNFLWYANKINTKILVYKEFSQFYLTKAGVISKNDCILIEQYY